ncbi:MAG: hypothetical protein AB7U20_24750, partial [Planctomycetaceae bacterium]
MNQFRSRLNFGRSEVNTSGKLRRPLMLRALQEVVPNPVDVARSEDQQDIARGRFSLYCGDDPVKTVDKLGR